MQHIINICVGVGNRRSGQRHHIVGISRQLQGALRVFAADTLDLMYFIEHQERSRIHQLLQSIQHTADCLIVDQDQIAATGVVLQCRAALLLGLVLRCVNI